VLTEHVEATGLATARNPRPRLMRPDPPPGGSAGQRVGASGESDRESPVRAALAVVERELARKQEARESGYGSPGRESSEGKLQGCERHERWPRSVGGHGKRRGLATPTRAASQPEPSRGARTLRTAPTGVWRPSSRAVSRKGDHGGEGAPDVEAFEGARTPREADPQGSGTTRLPSGGRAGEGAGGWRRVLEL